MRTRTGTASPSTRVGSNCHCLTASSAARSISRCRLEVTTFTAATCPVLATSAITTTSTGLSHTLSGGVRGGGAWTVAGGCCGALPGLSLAWMKVSTDNCGSATAAEAWVPKASVRRSAWCHLVIAGHRWKLCRQRPDNYTRQPFEFVRVGRRRPLMLLGSHIQQAASGHAGLSTCPSTHLCHHPARTAVPNKAEHAWSRQHATR